MTREALQEQNKQLLQELKKARAQIQRLQQMVEKLNDATDEAYLKSSYYEADQACMRYLKNQVETLKSQLSNSQEKNRKANEEIRLLNLERDTAVENMAYTQDEAHKDLIHHKMLAYELEAAHSDCRRLKFANKQLQEDNEVLQQKVEDLEHSAEAGRKKNDDKQKKKYKMFSDLIREGISMENIMEIMQISRSTYFRFLKRYKEDCMNNSSK